MNLVPLKSVADRARLIGGMQPLSYRTARGLRIITMAMAAWGCLGCEPIGHALAEDVDLLPPVFNGMTVTSATTVTARFDEPVTMAAEAVTIDPGLTVTGVGAGEEVIITTATPLMAGKSYTLRTTARDERGNTTTFVARFWGYNPRPPGLVINEFTTQGSKKRPDAIELYVTRDGNLGGVTVYDGCAENYRDYVVLPAVEVSTGDYIVIHATDNGLGEDEHDDADQSSHQLALPGVWDFWMEEGTGLSGKNGVLTVHAAPGGALLDGVLYSNRSSDSDERYRGFGSKATMLRADRLAELGGWRFAGEQIAPEDAISSAATTSTRSLNRDSSATDTDSAADWHTVPTRKASFGAANSDEVHG